MTYLNKTLTAYCLSCEREQPVYVSYYVEAHRWATCDMCNQRIECNGCGRIRRFPLSACDFPEPEGLPASELERIWAQLCGDPEVQQ